MSKFDLMYDIAMPTCWLLTDVVETNLDIRIFLNIQKRVFKYEENDLKA